MPGPDLTFENMALANGRSRIAGVDEVGRGPLAGPVVAAAVILGSNAPDGLNDSKALTAERREALAERIAASCTVSIASVPSPEIDAINIRQASLTAMVRAIHGLPAAPDWLLVDGNDMPIGLAMPGETIVKGDARSSSIAAASIVAKVFRDAMLARAETLWPGYGFAGHKGYGVPLHRAAIATRGPSPIHRMSFAPMRTKT